MSRSQPASPIDGVTYIASRATDAGSAIEKSEVVIATLSPRGDNAGTLPGVYQQLADAAAAAGARFIAIGGFSSLRPAEGAPRFAESDDLPPEYAAEGKEMCSILTDLEAGVTQADWLFAAPAAEFGSFVPGESLGHYRVSGGVALFDAQGKSAISGADFARAVVDEIETPTRHRA